MTAPRQCFGERGFGGRAGLISKSQSQAILRYLAQKYGPDSIYPSVPLARSHVERWLDWNIGTLAPVLNPVFITLYRTPVEQRNAADLAGMIERLTRTVAKLDGQLGARPYIAGDQFTIADVAFGHSIWRWFAFPFERPNLPNLAAWQARVSERPGFREYVAQPLS